MESSKGIAKANFFTEPSLTIDGSGTMISPIDVQSEFGGWKG